MSYVLHYAISDTNSKETELRGKDMCMCECVLIYSTSTTPEDLNKQLCKDNKKKKKRELAGINLFYCFSKAKSFLVLFPATFIKQSTTTTNYQHHRH